MNPFSPSPTPFDLRWRMFGIPIRVHWSFWLFSWIFSYFFQPPARNLGLDFRLLFIGIIFFAVLWAELGHALVGRMFGYRGQVLLYGMGGQAFGEYEQAPRWQRIVIHLAGPVSGFLLLLLTELFRMHLLPRIDPAGNNLLLWRGVKLMIFETFLWNFMNLLPVIPLRGGLVMQEITSAIFRKKGTALALLLSMTLAGFIAVYSGPVADWAARTFGRYFEYLQNLSPLVTAIFFGFYAFMNLFAFIREVTSSPKTPAPAEDEYAQISQNTNDAEDYPR